MSDNNDNEDEFDEEFDFLDDDDFEDSDSSNAEKTASSATPAIATSNSQSPINALLEKFSQKQLMLIGGGAGVFLLLIITFMLSGSDNIPEEPPITSQLESPPSNDATEIPGQEMLAANTATDNLNKVADNTSTEDMFEDPNAKTSRENIASMFNSKNQGQFNLDTVALSDDELLYGANEKTSEDVSQFNELQVSLDSITEEITENVNQIKQLEDTIQNINQTLQQVNQTMTGLDKKVLNLGDTVDNLSIDLAKLKKVMTEDDLDLLPNTGKKVTTPEKPSYVVHAIIPGRAWLKSSNGQIITIAEGDTLGDYGTIALIDAANSTVRTSSGICFK